MCLIINKVKSPKVQKDGYCVGYKVIYSSNNESIYRSNFYALGENNSTRENKALSLYEINCDKVSEGFHLFLRLKDAKSQCNDVRKVIRCFFKPEDVVAFGTWECGDGCPNVVVTKLLIKSLDHICKEK